ncbi:FAD-dependent pyridine nucleotide-disulfide oxidoreductase [Caballeronia calidae]|uniref:FAD-dependent pyridine nucleotide-disulfide oxidoreductase n=1 Tax=Caballeronia calidae TaxID=1777139 RepID=A0A158DUJ8_9BURK|nr:NAD(P)/FAD-dependent oxidoreductase [Caballeronia calidae]SAK98291.1 FAD-dependent pyridine nucleotide-disulfide oxidoreductase [Caballeronia calidae]
MEKALAAHLSDAEHISNWLGSFERALNAQDQFAVQSLFLKDSFWRDLFAITWHLTPSRGNESIAKTFIDEQPRVLACGFKIAAGRTPPRRVTRTGERVIEGIFQFDTSYGSGLGIVRIPVTDPGRAWVISTSVKELRGFEEPVGKRRREDAAGRVFGGPSWADRRAREQEYSDRDPAVLIVGGGHNGICMAARLRLLGVDALVIERLPKAGDVWRQRYESLALHNKIPLNDMPYIPFPASWPTFPTKDMLAEWIESYAIAMECNIWTSTEFVEGTWDEATRTWRARVRRKEGGERVFRPRHLIFANGVLGKPSLPNLPGLEEYKGQIIHSHYYKSGQSWKGKKVIVVGAGNTAHDIAQDLHGWGATVKMVQRGSVTVFSVKAASLNHAVHYTENLPTEDADLIITSTPFDLALRGYKINTRKMLEIDKELLDGLAARGFKTDIGTDGGGHQMKVRERHGGYSINVGCSDLIVNGKVGLIPAEDIVTYCDVGAILKDGSIVKADLIVMATGYHAPEEVIGEMLGREVMEKIGPVWGLGSDGELNNMYKPTAQKGLWFIGGGFAQGRIWSHHLAIQIKAREAGIVTEDNV